MNCFEKLLSQYDYADRLKPGGFVIDGKPALTRIEPELVGDYVIMVVRDPLLEYGGDPAEPRSGGPVRNVYHIFRLLQGCTYQHRQRW